MDFKQHLRKYLKDDEINELIASFNKKEHKGFYLSKASKNKTIGVIS